MKSFIKYIFYTLVLFTAAYLTYLAIISGEARIRTLVFVYSENPIMYVVAIIIMLVIIVFGFYVFGSEVFDSIDKKVKAFGGNYNINTFKAIFRNFKKNR